MLTAPAPHPASGDVRRVQRGHRPAPPLGRTTVRGSGFGDAEGVFGGRLDDERGRCYLRIFTALAITRITTTTEIISSAIIVSLPTV
jgi:hypothetical protein